MKNSTSLAWIIGLFLSNLWLAKRVVSYTNPTSVQQPLQEIFQVYQPPVTDRSGRIDIMLVYFNESCLLPKRRETFRWYNISISTFM